MAQLVGRRSLLSVLSTSCASCGASFASAPQGGAGMKPIADKLHSMGLRLGLWMLRGIPVSAVEAKSEILGGGGATADQARSLRAAAASLPHTGLTFLGVLTLSLCLCCPCACCPSAACRSFAWTRTARGRRRPSVRFCASHSR